MKDNTSQLLSLFSIAVIPFIPNNSLRYITVISTVLTLAAYLVYTNTPNRQVGWLDASVKELNALFDQAANECIRDPRFVYEAGLKLSEINYELSTLRSRVMSMGYTPWRPYLYHLRAIASSIQECRLEIEELRSSVLFALERARQQWYREDIDRRLATLARAFPEGSSHQSFAEGRRRISLPTNEQSYMSA
ncbi:hypothetical protein MSAN_00899800 [Mycena sanguinolenta]|uniref:Uncharacterized protein n=1 Tax=Mycena sanguinolenta TaxID=230812 RepID=A0A8H7D8R7_9AGAR|nr:hypothetical protein MSAN_00899800 [Mycena sanguinolenta]